MEPTTAIVAGCGDLGTEVGLRLAGLGMQVVGLRRRVSVLPDEIEGQAIDLSIAVPRLPPAATILVIALAADRRTPEAYHETYARGISNVIRGVRSSGLALTRTVLVSSTAVYGDCDGAWIDEETPAESKSPTAHVLREAERLAHEELPTVTSLRLAGLYGPGRDRLIERVRAGSVTLESDPHSFTNRIHRDDAAAAIVHLVTMPDAPEKIYVGSDHEPTPRGQVERFLADRLGVSVAIRERSEPSSGANKRCRNDLLRASGYEFRYPTYREGYRAVLAGSGRRHP